MNERIKQLAEQAELHATLLFNKDKLEKFAELLILECASIAYKSSDDGDMAAQEILYEFNINDCRNDK